jgi:tetraacyldisaccharide 4'-kinase
MPLKTPKFWEDPQDWRGFLLQPFAFLYERVLKERHEFQKKNLEKWTPPLPVICIGNFVAGGAGKTPVALAIGQLLQEAGKTVHFVTRGYGRQRRGVKTPFLVTKDKDKAAAVGDEPLLLARLAPTWVVDNRQQGIESAYEAGAQVVILDDGLQDETLVKTLSLAVVDGVRGMGNGRLLPAGPLREPLSMGLTRVQGVVVMGPKAHWAPSVQELEKALGDKPLLEASLTETPPVHEKGAVVAFAGIGYPKKFFQFLKESGYEVRGEFSFPDHYFYGEKDIKPLLDQADKEGASLITTEKDWVRLPSPLQKQIQTIKVRVVFQDERLDHLLRSLDGPKGEMEK